MFATQIVSVADDLQVSDSKALTGFKEQGDVHKHLSAFEEHYVLSYVLHMLKTEESEFLLAR